MINPNHYMVFDVETSGLKVKTGVVMEIAMIFLNEKLEEVDRYEAYLKPYKEVDYQPGALQAHGIPIQRTIDEGIEVTEVCKKIIELMKKYSKGNNKKVIVVGHNIYKFDLEWMRDMFLFAKPKAAFDPLYEIFLDTIMLARIKYGYEDILPNFKLGTCCAHEEIALIDAHRAMNDTVATSKLLIQYLEDLRSSSKGRQVVEEVRYRDTFYF